MWDRHQMGNEGAFEVNPVVNESTKSEHCAFVV